MIDRNLVALALESAIGAELAVFAAYLLSSSQRRSWALYLLAGLAICLVILTTGNLLIGNAGWEWLSDIILLVDLLAPPLVFLYVTQICREPRPLTLRECLHAAPALIGTLAWKAGWLSSMDLYVNVCWFGYLFATIFYFAAHYRAYAPPVRQRFLILLLTVLLVIWLLRLVIVAQAGDHASFREGLPYLLILGVIFIATCLMLFTALRHPDLLSLPGSHLKYALSTADEAELDRLEGRLAALLDEKRPYLDSDFSLAGLSALMEAPARHVSQLINARHGMSFSAYMNFHRASLAAKLLATTAKSVKTIMFESGFSSKSIFNREFQRHFGHSPSDYRRQADGKSR